MTRERRRDFGDARAWARGLGWFSIGLGLAELRAPRLLAALIGLPARGRHRSTLAALGARELLTGAGMLTQAPSAGWLWLRVAGDLIDLGLLGAAFGVRRADRARLAAAVGAVAGVTALDVITARRLGGGWRPSLSADEAVRASVTIRRSPAEVYRFWRELPNLSRFTAHVEAVEPIDQRRSRWVVRAPAGGTVSWEAEIVDDRPDERIAWRTVMGAGLAQSGVVRFVPAPNERGTEVHVEVRYQAPGGKIGVAVAKLFGEEPEQQIRGDLRRLKQVLETGEVLHSDASLHRGMHPARPAQESNLARPQPPSGLRPLPRVQPTTPSPHEEQRS